MDILADIFLVAGAFGAAAYCYVLSLRLRRFNDLEKGVGGAVAVLSAQVDDLTRTLTAAQDSSGETSEALQGLTQRAEGVAERLELLLASFHDVAPQTQDRGRGPAVDPSVLAAASQKSARNGDARGEAKSEGPMFMRRER